MIGMGIPISQRSIEGMTCRAFQQVPANQCSHWSAQCEVIFDVSRSLLGTTQAPLRQCTAGTHLVRARLAARQVPICPTDRRSSVTKLRPDEINGSVAS